MRIIKTSEPLPQDTTTGLWVYNGLDCCITLEVLHVLLPQLDEITGLTYAKAFAMQAPILEMQCRGVLIDKTKIGETYALLMDQLNILQESLREILIEGLGLGPDEVSTFKREKGQLVEKFMWNSPKQLQHFFYTRLGLTPVRAKGIITADRKALEKLRNHFHVEVLVSHILAIRDCTKRMGVLRTPIDPDGRMRTTFNIAGTDTGRLSSYGSCFYSGTNLQNITGELRGIFTADPGKKFVYIDLEQAEARAVGAIVWNLFGDPLFLDFCESGDLHTNVAKMTFDELSWTDDPKANRKIADQQFYRDFSYRDATKRLGHGTNYYGQAPQMAKETRIAHPLVAAFQTKYFLAFPGIKKWHEWVDRTLRTKGYITTFMGRRRHFLGRLWDKETLRGAIAYEPQSAIAQYINDGILAIWKETVYNDLPVELLLQIHDAILAQIPDDPVREPALIARMQELLEFPVELMNDRTLVLPTEAMVGWNWAYTHNARKELVNPDGLVKFKGSDTRKRTAQVSFLHRQLS